MPKISALPIATTAGTGDLLVLDQGLVTKRIDFNTLQSAVANAGVVQTLIAQSLSSALSNSNPIFSTIRTTGPAIFGSGLTVAGGLTLGTGLPSSLSQFSYTAIYPSGTIAAHLQQNINVSDAPWNVKGDGVTDNTVALASLQTYLSGLTTPPLAIFPAGTYLYSTSPNWSFVGSHIRAEGLVVLKHTGTGNAWIYDSGAVSGIITNCRMEGPFEIDGNANSTNGLFIRSVHHSYFEVRIRNCATTGAGILVNFGVCNVYMRPRISSVEGAFTFKPLVGILFDLRGVGEPVTYSTIIEPIIEGVPTGIKLVNADGNIFLGGTCESCSVRGIEESSTCHENQFINMDLEQNTTDDANCAGVLTTFSNTDSNNLISLTGSCQVIRGGRHNSITTNGTGNVFEDLRYNRNGTGTFTDISNSATAKRSVFNTAGSVDTDIYPTSISVGGKIYPGTTASALQVVAGIYAQNGLASNALGAAGDTLFRGDGGLGSSIYKKFAAPNWPIGSWTPII